MPSQDINADTTTHSVGIGESKKPLRLLWSRAEAGNVKTFAFETGALRWVAGQLQGYTLPRAGDTEAENHRWFTIASAPNEETVNISTRISASNFKQCLNALEPGDQILAEGVEGDFTWEDPSSERVILVAGGIGITPFRSILLSRAATGKPLSSRLLYFNRDNDIPFEPELERLQLEHDEFSVSSIVGRPITAQTILGHAPEASQSLVYLSGPEPMVESVGAELKERGIRLKQDWFPGYDEKDY